MTSWNRILSSSDEVGVIKSCLFKFIVFRGLYLYLQKFEYSNASDVIINLLKVRLRFWVWMNPTYIFIWAVSALVILEEILLAWAIWYFMPSREEREHDTGCHFLTSKDSHYARFYSSQPSANKCVKSQRESAKVGWRLDLHCTNSTMSNGKLVQNLLIVVLHRWWCQTKIG